MNREFKFDTTEIRVVDEKTQAEIDKINIDSGKMIFDEIRQRDGLAPIPGGNGSIHRVDLNHVNIELVDEYQMNKSRATDKKLKGGEEMKNKRESCNIIEVRSNDDNEMVIEGYALKFDTWSENLGGFKKRFHVAL